MEPKIAAASETNSAASTFRASAAERREPVRASSSLVGVNRWIALAAAVFLHAAILGPLLFNFHFGPSPAPPEEATPVEIVVEQPKPPPPPPPPPQPAAPRPQLDLKPAYDAPRTASDEKTPLDGADAKTNGEKAPTPAAPQAGAPAPPSQEAKAEPAAPATPAAAKDDDGEMKASDEPPTLAAPPAAPSDAPASDAKVATMIGQPLPTWSKDKQFSTFEPVPDVQFGASATSPIGGGQAATTYLTIVYGLVMKHLRLPAAVKAESQNVQGVIDFTVDGHGDIVERSVVQPSGSNGLDAAALEAVREAAPYPTPPMGMPIGLKFTYGGK